MGDWFLGEKKGNFGEIRWEWRKKRLVLGGYLIFRYSLGWALGDVKKKDIHILMFTLNFLKNLLGLGFKLT
jgi:hypothetical protein